MILQLGTVTRPALEHVANSQAGPVCVVGSVAADRAYYALAHCPHGAGDTLALRDSDFTSLTYDSANLLIARWYEQKRRAWACCATTQEVAPNG